MLTTRNQLFEYFSELGINVSSVRHAPVFTVDESKAICGHLPGAHCKNLFLKDKKGDLWLVVCLNDRSINMKELRHKIGASHLSFGKPVLLKEVLGVMPGSVTPFSLINDKLCKVHVVLDSEMMNSTLLNYHPLQNDETTSITPNDLLSFIRACGHAPRILDL